MYDVKLIDKFVLPVHPRKVKKTHNTSNDDTYNHMLMDKLRDEN